MGILIISMILLVPVLLLFLIIGIMADAKSSQKTSPKIIFYHLLAMISLYISAISFIVMVFQIINITMPDPAVRYYAEAGAREALRMAISFLIVMFPVYIWTTRSLLKIYDKSKAISQLKVRKWLVHFTQFVSALIVLFSIVVLLNQFMGGELTIRFFLKLLTVLFVAIAVFGYYRWELKEAPGKEDK